MARRSIWQEIRDWLRPSVGDLEASSEDASVSKNGGPSTGSPPSASRSSAPAAARVVHSVALGSDPPAGAVSAREADDADWPANVVPLVRTAKIRPGRATFDGAGGRDDLAGIVGIGTGGDAVLDDAFPDSELLDFMAADVDPVPADPAFRDRLREQLWSMIVEERVAVPGPVAVTRSVDPDERGPGSV